MNDAIAPNVLAMLAILVLPLLAVAFILVMRSAVKLRKELEDQGKQIALLEAKIMKEDE